MPYRVFYTDVKLPSGQSQPDFSKLAPFAFDSLNVALEKAFVLIEHRAIVWKIDGPDGFQMSRAQVENAYESKTGKQPGT